MVTQNILIFRGDVGRKRCVETIWNDVGAVHGGQKYDGRRHWRIQEEYDSGKEWKYGEKKLFPKGFAISYMLKSVFHYTCKG